MISIDRFLHFSYAIHVLQKIKKELFMLAIRLSADIEARLDALAKSTGRTKSFYAREAIMEHLEDLEDYYLAVERTKSGTQGIPLDEVEQRLGLAD
jgi:RHH-type rel operon transcriptional repressor/antitoxin RelB